MNDYLLPTLVLDIKKYKTIPMAVSISVAASDMYEWDQ